MKERDPKLYKISKFLFYLMLNYYDQSNSKIYIDTI